jgi:aminoglycoside phosphotransferase (APT) family kinase protein
MSDTSYLDTEAVDKWLSANLSGFSGPIKAYKFSNGQSNPTFGLKATSGNYVLRRKPPGVLLKSAHAVDREFRVQKALENTDVPVAKMDVLCEDDAIIGSAFYVMQMVDGANYDNPSLPELSFADRKPLLYEMNRVLAAIHSVDLAKVGLSDFGPDGNYYRRQTDRWTKQYRATGTEAIPQMDELMTWLDSHMPPDDGQRTLVHGDYRIDNILFSKTVPECLAVLDWELSTIGHPYADLAAVIMQWSMPSGKGERGLAGVDRTAHGLMKDQDFIDAYCDRRGLAGIEDFGFYLAFCFFRMGGILQGVKKRALDGNASNPERALKVGSYVKECAIAGLKAAKTV